MTLLFFVLAANLACKHVLELFSYIGSLFNKAEDAVKLILCCCYRLCLNRNKFSASVIFYDKDYYDSFWERHSLEQKWMPVADTETSFALKRNIQTSLKEIGYIETIFDSDFNKKSAIWFYGDV